MPVLQTTLLPKQLSDRSLSIAKALVFVLALLPACRLVFAAVTGDFGPNPVEFLQRFTGTWTFNLLLMTLAITPLRALTGAHWLVRLRRMLGLFSFFYGSLHFLSFIGFDHSFDIPEIAADILKRPFVTVGFAALALMLPLALTSNAFAIRRLGGKRWQTIHRAIYPIAILAAFHYFWLVKATALIYPIIYSAILAALLGWRMVDRIRRYGPYPSKQAPAGTPVRFFPKKP